MVVGEILASSTELYKEDPQLNLIPRKGVGELLISSHGDDQRIFFGFEIFYSGIFWGREQSEDLWWHPRIPGPRSSANEV